MGKGKYLKKAKASTGKKILRAVLIVLLVLVLLVGAVFVFIMSKVGKITFDDGSHKETVATVETIANTNDPTEAYVPTETAGATEVPGATEEITAGTEPDEIIDMGDLTLQDAPSYSSGELFKNKDVMNILLQILDDGIITDSHGKQVDFSNTVIVMTTNAGSTGKSAAAGFTMSAAEVNEDKTKKALNDFLRPEFINRVDEIITFRGLDEHDFVGIARIMLEELKTALAEKSITLSYTDEALELIAKASYSRKFGARNMRRYIQKEVEDRLAEKIIADYTHKYSVAKVVVEGDSINVLCM
mgnify:CR=1 FL=1